MINSDNSDNSDQSSSDAIDKPISEEIINNGEDGYSWGKILLISFFAFILYFSLNIFFTILIANNDILLRFAVGSSSILVFGGYFYFFSIRSSKNNAKEVGLIPFSFGKPKWMFYGILMILIYVIFAIIITMPFSQFWNIIFNGNVFSKENLSNLFWIELIVIGIIAPIFEELFFRGLVYTEIRKKVGIQKGILISALIFGIGHLNIFGALIFGMGNLNIFQAIITFLISIPLAYLYEKSKSLYVPMILHVLSNILIHVASVVFVFYYT